MKKWAGKLVVGLGGSAGTGKDGVQKMLEMLGAYTIDSDEIANRVLLVGAPGYQPIVENFGEKILGENGQIDRSRLYQFVRLDRLAREKLQTIIDPLIQQAIISLLQRAGQPVVVIKATNLSRFGLLELCDRVWVITAPDEVQVSNLIRKKGWSAEQAREYIRKQPEVDLQLAHADTVLYNKGSRGALWRQVTEAWEKLVGGNVTEVAPAVDTKAVSGSVLSRLPGQT